MSNVIMVQIYLYAAMLWGGVLLWILKVHDSDNVAGCKWLKWLGRHSYEIYLFHWPISYIILKPIIFNPYIKFVCTLCGALLIVMMLNLLHKGTMRIKTVVWKNVS